MMIIMSYILWLFWWRKLHNEVSECLTYLTLEVKLRFYHHHDNDRLRLKKDDLRLHLWLSYYVEKCDVTLSLLMCISLSPVKII